MSGGVMEEIEELVAKGSAALEERRFTEAEEHYQQALKLKPGNGAALLGLAMVYNRTGAPQKAKALLASLIKSFEAHAKKASSQKRGGKKAAAAKQPLPSSASQAEVYAQMGYACALLGELQEARSFFQKANELFPAPKLAEAISAIDQALAPKDPVKQTLAQASLWVGAGQLEKALEVLKKGLSQWPENAALLHATAMVLRGLKQPDEAMRLMQLAIVLDPDQALYFNDLGMLFLDQREPSKALTCYRRAVARDPNYAIAYSNMGVVYKQMGQIDEAIAAYRKAIELQPNLAAAHNNLGNLLRMKGEWFEAKQHLLRALELQPDYPDAKANLAALLEEESRR